MSQPLTTSIEHVRDLQPEVARALLQWGVALADTKFRLGMQFSNWVTGTPALEAAVGAAAMTQDELGHARSLWALLRELPDAPAGLDSNEDLGTRNVFYSPEALNPAWPSFLDFVAASHALDHLLQLAVESALGSRLAPLAGLAGKIVQEEAHHRVFGDGWVSQLLQNRAVAARLQQAIARSNSIAEAWIGADDDAALLTLKTAGILNADARDLRARWRSMGSTPMQTPVKETRTIACAFCNTTDVTPFSLFGQTLLGAQYSCNRCHSVFEVVRFT